MPRGQQPKRGESSASAMVSQTRPSASHPGMDSSISRTEARMFVMIRQETQYDLGMISSLLSICSMDVYVLIDPGSMHSYISFMFSQYMNKIVDWLDSQLIVTMLVGRPFIVD